MVKTNLDEIAKLKLSVHQLEKRPEVQSSSLRTRLRAGETRSIKRAINQKKEMELVATMVVLFSDS